MFNIIMRNRFKIFFPLILSFLAVYYQDTLQFYYNSYVKSRHSSNERNGIFSIEALAKYDGVQKKKLYMAVLGVVYDVSSGKQHYAKGSPYHYFVGKDGSRALVTGDFQNESENKDHVLDLSCNDFLSVMKWRDSLQNKYKKVGILAGRFYDTEGKSTPYSIEVEDKIVLCLGEKEKERRQDAQYPPCNIAWSQEEGTKVWCTKTSGGVKRDWVGVPRQLYTPGEKRPKCVCVNTDHQDFTIKFKEYENCANTSVVCYITSN